MRRAILPYPMVSFFLLLFWLVLQQSAGLGHILLGSVIAIFAGKALAALQLEHPKVRNSIAIIKLIGLVVADVVRSNLAVMQLVLSGQKQKHHSGFILVPLDLKDRSGLAVLACIVTATPGSAWLEYDVARSTVLIHVLDLVDEDEWIETLKNRYERLLLEIFR
jgi:multicomponent K+:H+ antiporter subunit E